MADTMQFDLVSPERNLVSVPAREVDSSNFVRVARAASISA